MVLTVSYGATLKYRRTCSARPPKSSSHAVRRSSCTENKTPASANIAIRSNALSAISDAVYSKCGFAWK